MKIALGFNLGLFMGALFSESGPAPLFSFIAIAAAIAIAAYGIYISDE